MQSDNPYLSYIELGQGDRLEAWELAQSIRNARLLVLSACNTFHEAGGVDPLARNEADVTSLTAFAFAGNVRWVVATLWEANDFYTNSIIQAFYAKLDVNMDPARALQEAKRPFVGRTLPANYLSLTISIRDINAL